MTTRNATGSRVLLGVLLIAILPSQVYARNGFAASMSAFEAAPRADTAVVTLADAAVDEDDATVFRVPLDRAVERGLAVTPSFNDGNAPTGAAPAITSVAITSTPSFDADGDGTAETYLRRESIEVTVTWSEDVVWDVSASGAELRLRLDVEGQSNTTKIARLVTGGATSGTARSLAFRYPVGARDRDTDGVFPKPAGNGNIVHLVGGATLKDSGGQNVPRAHGGLTADPNHQVNGSPNATAPAVVTIADAAADEGDDITFTVTLDKAVAGGFTVTPSFTDGTATEGEDYSENKAGISFAGTKGETQTFTVATTDDTDEESDETFTVALAVSGTTQTVTATSSATGTIRDDDETPEPPALSSVAITSTPSFDADGDGTAETYLRRESIEVTVTWSEDVVWDVSASGAELRLRLDVEGQSNTTKVAHLVTGGATSGTARSLAFRYPVGARDRDTDGVFPKPAGNGNIVHLVGGATLRDAHGQDVPRAHGGLTADPSHQVNGSPNATAPAVVTIADAAADEGDDITFTVTLDKAVASGFTVTPSFTDGTATEGTDYTENTAGISFAGTKGETQTFTVATTEDSEEESDETFRVSLRVSGTSASVTATSRATGTIRDDDETPAVVAIADAAADEGDDITFTVTLDKAVASGFTVTPSFTDGTATEGTDYTENTAGISFAGTKGETRTFTVATTEDSEEESDETFRVSLRVSGTSASVTATSRATGTIRNDDETPAVVTIADAAADEGDDITFTVTLDKAVASGFTVTPSFTDGTATEGTDYTENTAGISFAGTKGETQTFTVATTEDSEEESDETFRVSLRVSGTSASVTATSRATGTIRDDDETPAVVTIADAAADEGDDITFTVTLDKAVASGFTVTPSFTDGTATEGTDYTENTAGISFAGTKGETQTFTVATTEDSEEESDETFRVSLRVSGTSASVTATSRATGTIRDDDETPAVVTIADAAADEGDDITFTVTLDKAVASGFTVTPSFTDGTATEGTDYTENTAGISFAGTKGETRTFTVATTEDSEEESDETFRVSLRVSGTSASVTATSRATGTIRNDDETPEPPALSSVAITSTPSFDADGDGTAETYLRRDNIEVTVTYAEAVVWDVSASGAELRLRLDVEGQSNTTKIARLVTDGATSGTARSLAFRYAVGARDRDTDGVFPKPAGNGNIVHLVGGATLKDSHGQDVPRAHGGLTAGPNHQVNGTAVVTIADAAADEGDDITFTMTLGNAVAGGFTVTPSFTDGTATEGNDYTENTAGISFAGTRGETQTFTVATTEDADEESDETFTVALTVSGTTETVTATDTATGTIRNDDETPEPPALSSVAITSTPSFDADGDGTAETYLRRESIEVTVTWSEDVVWDVSASGAELRLRLDVEGQSNTTKVARLVTGGATSGTARSLAFRYPVGARDRDTDGVFPKPAGNGNIVHLVGGATLKDAHGQDVPRAHGGLSADPNHQVNGSPNATAPAVVTVADAAADEGDDITFTVTLDEAVAGGFTVTPSFTDGTATEGTDYTENTAGISFAGTKGETQTFTVATTDDSDEESDETFTVALAVSGTTQTVTATSTATGTIRDDDRGATRSATTSVTIIDASAAEGASLTFTVTLNKAVSGGFTVTPSFTDGTATEGTDYTENTAGISFAGTKGETQTFTVATTEDPVVESDEIFTVALAVSGTSETVTATSTATGTIRNDDRGATRSNTSAPVITAPDAKTYEQGESITAFGITVTDADGDTVTVTVTGLPSGLSYTNDQVQGTVEVNASIQDYTVTISADDGVNTATTATFTITVTPHWNRPTVDISGPTSAQRGGFDVRIIFSEDVTGFTKSDVTVGNGSVTWFSGDGYSYDATIAPAATGTVTVDVAANVAEDGAEYGNVAAPRFSVEYDVDAPTVSISGPTASQSESFDLTITFSESVTGFDQADVTVGGGSVTAWSGSGASYTAKITPTANGTLTVDVAANVAADIAGNRNTAASQFTVPVALTRPTVVISGPASVQTGVFSVSIAFSHAVTGFAQADVTVGNGRMTGWAETNGRASVYITPAASGAVTIDVPPNVATDGNGNGNLAAVQYSVEASLGEPTVTITCPTGVQTGAFHMPITFSESVTGFAKSDLQVGNGRVTSWAETNGRASVYITPAATGTVTIDVPANVATDSDGYGNLAAQQCSVQADLDAPALTVTDASAAEGDQLTFTVALDKAVSGGFTVTPSFVDGTASKSTDYTENLAGISFAGTAGEKQTFTVATAEDTAVEANETFTVSLSVSETTATVKATDTATGTIIDDDGATSVTVIDASAAEGASFTFTVTLNKAVSGGFTVTPGFAGGTAAKGGDYTANTAALSFAGTAGEQHTFTVATTEDEVVEYDETFTVSLAVSGTSESVTATSTATGTITNDDFATVTIDDATALETYTSLVPVAFGARVDKAVQGGFLLKTVVTNGTATNGSDFRGIPTQIPITGGPASFFLSLIPVNDVIVEGTETFTIGFEVSGAPPGVRATDTATGTITDDDGAAVTIADASAREGNTITFTATVDRAVVGGFTVTPSFTDGTAASGTDYTQNAAALTFAGTVGEQKTFTVATAADTLDTSNKTFTVGLSLSNTSLWVKATDTATGTILDTAAPEPPAPKGPNSPPVIAQMEGIRAFQYQAIEPWTIPVSDADGDTLTLTLENLPPGLSYSDGAVRGTALPDDPRIRYSSSRDWKVTVEADDGVAAPVSRIFNYRVYWPAPEITVPGNKTYEQGEAIAAFAIEVTEPGSTTVTVTGLPSGLSYASGQVQGTVAADADVKHYTVTITADDNSHPAVTDTFTVTVTPPSAPKVTIEDASAAEGDSITFTVTLNKAVSGGLTVTPSFTDGTAAERTDYTGNTAALSFTGTAGEQQTFTVATTEDTDIEADETFTVSLAVSGTSDTVTATDTATGTITNDDARAVTIADASASEGDSMTFTVTLDGAVAGGFTVTPSFTDVTARSGVDYTRNTTAITFAGTAGETRTFTVATTEDAYQEADETFTVGLSVSGASLSVGASGTATGTILDDGDATTNSPPVIKPLNIRHYDFQYQTILPWCIKVHDDDGDDVTVTVTGLPQGLSHSDSDSCSGGTVSGTAMPNTHRIPARRDNAFIVKVNADDGVNAVVTHSFNYFVMWGRPHITSPGDKTYQQGEQIAAFDIVVDADEKYKEVGLTGLPDSLSYEPASEQVTGSVAANAEIKDYTVTITADGDGPGWLSPVTETFTITVISSRPDVQISGPADAQNSAFDVTVTFSEPVTGFEKGDVTVGNGTATALSGSGSSYTATITPTASGTVTVDVDENVAEDGASNGNTAASRYSVEADLDAPTVSITGPTASQSASFDVTITFTESVTGFEQQEVTVGNGAATALTGSGASYTATITPTASGTLTVDVDENVAEDGAGNGNTAADQFTVPVNLTRPTVVISCPTVTQTGAFDAGITFSETVTGFEQAEAKVGNGTVTALTGSGASYTATITPAATGTLTVDVAENVAADGDGHGNLAAQRCRVPVNLDDPKLTIFDESASEGDSMTFNVTLDKDVPGGFTVTPSFTDVTATKGTDYTENTAALSFKGTAGEEQTFTVATIEDAANEPDETFTVGLSVSGTSLAVTDTEIATGTITDDDVLQRTKVTIADGIAAEGDSLTFTMTLNNAVSGGFALTPDFTDLTATKGTDYTAKTAVIKFDGTAGEKQTLTVETVDDDDAESNELFEVSLSVSATTAQVKTIEAKGLIVDNDAAAVTIADASVEEGDSITFTVTLDQAVTDGLTVTPSFTDVTATEGTDYTENTTGLSFTGTAGETQSFTVATTEDTGVESDETFTVSLTVSNTSETVTATDIATGTITNDDTPVVTIEDASASEGDQITFSVILDKAVTGGFTVTPSFTDGTATKGTDYTENTAALSFAGTVGEIQTFTVATTEDTDSEVDETFTVGLTVSGTQATVTATSTATGTILDDETPAVTIADASAEEGDDITFTVTLDKAVASGFTVTPSFEEVTATNGRDYAENTAALSFAGTAGETQTFIVATVEDTDSEADETFTVGLTVSGTQATVTATSTATGTILDDDTPAVTIADASAAEGDSITFTVTLDKALAGGFSVTPGFTDVTATKGTDYTENTAALTFTGTAGETQTFTVATTEDTDAELDETFTVNLVISGTTAPVTATDTATGTITNDDGAVPAVTIEDASAAEGDSITFTVTLDKAVSGGLTVTPSFTDETATKGIDYIENTDALTFTGTAGEEQTFSVATKEDEDDDDETFTVSLTVSGTSATVASDTATGTVTADRPGSSPAVVSVADASANEGDSITFTVTLDKAVAGGFSVTPSFTDGTATKGTDYTENTAAITFAGTAGETQTFTVATTEDTEGESDETFTVGLAVSGLSGTETVTATDTATGTIVDDDGPAVTIADASASEGDSLTFTVTLSKAVSGGLTVTPSFTDGTATKGTDYTENTAALTFAGTAGETQTFTVATTEDTDSEADETFTVGLTVSTAQEPVAATDTATGTIVDDDGPAVTIADASASEGDSLTFTVTLSKAVSGGLTVTPSFTDGTATKGTDYTENTAALTFAGTAGETQTFTVATTEDNDSEADETFTVGLAVSGTQETVAATSTATGTILDDEAPAVTVADASAAEGDALTFTVTLDKAVAGGFTVTPSFTDVTATKGTDYTENTAALTFAGTAGETMTFTVATTEDTDSEADETFTVGLAVSGTQETVTATSTATGTILDDEAPAVTIADASAAEGDALTFTVTLSKAVSGGLTVTPSFTDGTATKGTDYTENTAALTFAGTAGETQTFTVATTEDTDSEADETFTVGLAVSGTQETVAATSTATGTILDDEAPAVTIADASAAEGDALTFTVTLDKAVAGGFTVTPSFTDVTATKGTDYTENTAALTFAGTAGETMTFTVATTEDTDSEADETFTVGLAVSGTQETVTATSTATGTILDDEAPAVTIADASAAEGDALTFTVTLDKAVAGGITVTPAFTDVTATKGTDYTENIAALAFAGTAAETQTFTVATTEDTDSEVDETFTVGLAVSGTQETVTATSTATGTILDDEAPAVTIADASAAEGDSVTFTVTLDKAVAGGFTVTPSFTDVTATKGTDYTENTAALTFAGTAGETQTFNVATTEDTDSEADETFTVGLAVSGTSETVTATSTATGTIRDDDRNTNDNAATVTIADASAEEGDEITFTVTLDNAVGGGFTLTPSFTDGTATSGTDYTENTAALTFAGTAGETQTFTVATTEDADEEDDETFTVGLSVSGTSETVTATSTATGTIRDDDRNTNDNGATVTIADASTEEGDEITFAVTLDNAVGGGFTVTPSFTDGTATSGTDYTENTTALTFAGTAGETQTFTVATTEDADEEDDETFTVGLSVSGTSETVTATSTATGTIRDDDRNTNDNGATVTIADASAEEGDELTFTVTLDQAVGGGFTVTPSFTDGTATSGTDYTENTTALTFAGTAGETQTFTVATTEDADEEDDETFTVGLSVSGTSETVTATSTATGTIRDDDDGNTNDNGATVTIADASAEEGDELTFTVTLDNAVGGGFTVTPSFTDGTATSGTDYTENTTALTFAGTAGETQTFTMTTTDDAVVEADETFAVGLSVSGTSETVGATDTATGTILDDDGGTTGDATVTIAHASAEEGEAITFTVTLKQAVQGGLTVTASFTDVTATEGTDYTVGTTALTFAGTAGERQTLTVATTEDAVTEADETFTVGLSLSDAPSGVTAGDPATGTILDDDGGATVTIADASADEGEAITFTVTLDNAVGGSFTVTPSFTDGTATSGADYTENTASLTFAGAAGETHALKVSTIEDAVFEADETFTVALTVSGTPPGVAVSSNDTGTGTIRNDDGHHVSLSASPAEVPEGASPTVVTVTATAASASSSARSVVVAVGGHGDDATAMAVAADRYDDGGPTSRMMAVGDDATTGDTDYLAVDDFQVTIPANETSGTATFTLVPIDDLIVEGNEAISVTGAGTLMVVTGTSMTLVDNDRHEVTLSASPAEVAEGASPTLVTVRAAFSNGGSFPVDKTVVVRVGGGTAESGTDYDATPDFAVTIAAGATRGTGTFTLVPADDDIVEGDETIEVSGASEGLAVHDALLTLADDDAVPERGGALEFGLAGIGRTIATQAVDAIGARFEAASRLSRAAAPDDRLELDPFAVAGILQAAGVDFPRLDARASVPGDLGTSRPGTTGGGAWSHTGLQGGRGLGNVGLLARAFGADGSGAGGWTLWTTGAGTNFSGHPGDFSVDGRMGAAYLGVDRNLGSNAVLGVAVARNQGGVNAEHDSNWMGDLDARLTTVYPYARWAPTPKLDLWGTLGLGRGDVEMDDGASSFLTDSRLRMGAMGLRGDLASVGAVDLAVRADAFTVGMTADEVAGTIKAADGRAQRARLILDVSTAWALSSSSRLTPSIEVGARADGGDVETGPGMELGGGLAYGNSRLGLDITARGRWLAVHRDDRFGEWGANMSIRRMPSNPNRGLSISVEPAWSEDASGITALWEGRNLRRGDFGFGLRPENASAAWQPDRLDMQVSYGTDLLTPFGRMRMMGGGSRHLQVGTALELAGARDGGRLKLEILGEQRARAGGAADYGATLRLAGANLGPAGGVAAPFGEFTQESAGQRLKLGTQLQLAAGGKLRNVLPRFRLEMGGEANRKAHEGTKYGFFLRGSSTLGGW